MIGNDIIDIRLLHQHPRSGHSRFWQKILSQSELEWLHTSGYPPFDIWKLWALKESAYKCYFQQTRHRFFAPKKFICQWTADHSKQARVFTPAGTLYAEIHQSEGYIHAVCSDSWERLGSNFLYVSRIHSQNAGDLSLQLRSQVLHWMTQQMAFDPGELSWNDTAGFPRLTRHKELLNISLSLSHHGEWGAATFRTESIGKHPYDKSSVIFNSSYNSEWSFQKLR